MQLARREPVKTDDSVELWVEPVLFFFAFNLNHVLKNGTDGS